MGAAFDPKKNALNALRLVFATLVIVYHSFFLAGTRVEPFALRQLAGRISVDGFFAISGYLIVSSWVRTPKWGKYLWARSLRIFPAFWVSLVVTAFVIAPVALLIQQAAFPGRYWSDAVAYVVKNAALRVQQFDIAGTPTGVANPAVWNGSMWTLFWEFLCYLGVLVLGLTRLMRWKHIFTVGFVLATIGVLVTSYGPVGNYYIKNGAHFGIMFLAGALIFRFQDRIVIRPVYLSVAAIVIVASAWLPDYRVVAALPLAYLVISLGVLGKSPRLQVHNDLSYGTYIFAFPLQQLLATAGAAALGVPIFILLSVAVTFPIAAVSWFCIEKPALRLKRVGRARTVQQEVVAQPNTAV